MKKLALIPVALAVIGLGACSGTDASREDAHDVPGNLVDKTKPHSVTFNNHFSNVETKCLGAPPRDQDGAPQGVRDPKDTADDGGGWRVVVTSSKKLILVQDPSCPGYDPKANLPAAVTASP